MWSPIGTLNLNQNWQLFDTPLIGSETIRVVMPPGIAVDGYLLIAPYYAGAGRGRTQRIYASDDAQVITVSIPPDLRDSNEIVRFLGAKLGTRARVLSGTVWSITCEVFT